MQFKANIDWPNWIDTDAAFTRMTTFDATPLMRQWEGIIVEGNRRGVLSGLDGFNQPMPPLKYRGGKGKPTRNRRAPNFGKRKHEPTAIGYDDNLTTWQYQRYTGPRLAPRRELSRVISNLETSVMSDPSSGVWAAIGAWRYVVSSKGKKFLPYHFAENRGKATFPRYDLRPVRPQDVQFALNALEAFVKKLFRVTRA